MREARRSRVPVGHAVGRSVGHEEVRRRLRDLEEPLQHPGLAHRAVEACLGHLGEELDLFGEAAQDPGQAPRPGREGRVPLLRARAAVGAVLDVEDRLVGDPAPHVVGVAPFPEVHVVARGGLGVLDEAREQRHRPVALSHQHVAELVGQGQRPQRADGVGEERMRAVE